MSPVRVGEVRQASKSPWSSAASVDAVLGHFGRRSGAEVSGVKGLRPRPPVSVVITQVSRAARVAPEVLRHPRGNRGGWARPVAMALAWEVCGLGQRAIREAFGISPYAVSKAIARARELAGRRGATRLIKSLNSNLNS